MANKASIKMGRILKHTMLIALISVIALLFGCRSRLNSDSISDKNGQLYEKYFIGDQAAEYFIRPLTFTDATNKKPLLIDFSFFHSTGDITTDVTYNFSIKGKQAIEDITKIRFECGPIIKEYDAVELQFCDEIEDFVESRYSGTTTISQLKEMFAYNNWTLTITRPSGSVVFKPVKIASKSIKEINETLITTLN